VITPPPGLLTLPGGGESALITETNVPGKFTISYEFKLTPAIVNPGNYPAMLKLESSLSKKSSRVFLLEGE
jgi:hypothetical protein